MFSSTLDIVYLQYYYITGVKTPNNYLVPIHVTCRLLFIIIIILIYTYLDTEKHVVFIIVLLWHNNICVYYYTEYSFKF